MSQSFLMQFIIPLITTSTTAQPAFQAIRHPFSNKTPKPNKWHAILSGSNERKIMPQLTSAVSLLTPAPPQDKPIFGCHGPELINIVPCLIAICYILIGIYYMTVGYRTMKYSMPTSSFTLVAGLNFVLLMQGNFLPLYGNCLLSILIGIVFTVFTHRVLCLGIISSGFQSGVILAGLATWIYALIFGKDISASYMGVIIVLLLAGIVGAVLSAYFPSAITIASMCISGSVIMSISIDYLISRGASTLWMFELTKSDRVQGPPPCLFTLFILCLCPVYAIVSTVLQTFLFGNTVHLVACKNAYYVCLKTKKQEDGRRTRRF